jgi:hypothetical protein
VFGLVTGGFALEKKLKSARPGKTPRPRTAQHSTVNPCKRERKTVVEGGIKEAAPVDMPAKVDDCAGAQAAAQKSRGPRKRPDA